MLKNQIVTLRPDNCALMAMVHNLCANTAKKHILLSTFASGFFSFFIWASTTNRPLTGWPTSWFLQLINLNGLQLTTLPTNKIAFEILRLHFIFFRIVCTCDLNKLSLLHRIILRLVHTNTYTARRRRKKEAPTDSIIGDFICHQLK